MLEGEAAVHDLDGLVAKVRRVERDQAPAVPALNLRVEDSRAANAAAPSSGEGEAQALLVQLRWQEADPRLERIQALGAVV